jgi:hypothetical protein
MRTVENIAKEIDVRLTVVGVVGGKARSNYVEVLLGIEGCEDEPCRVTIGVNRLASPDEIRSAIRKPLEAYLRRHTH